MGAKGGDRFLLWCSAGIASIPALPWLGGGGHWSSAGLCLHGNGAAIFQGGKNLCVFSCDTSPGQQHQQATTVLWGWGMWRGNGSASPLWGKGETPRPKSCPDPGLSTLAAPRARVQGWQGKAEPTPAAGCCPFTALFAPGGNICPRGPLAWWRGWEESHPEEGTAPVGKQEGQKYGQGGSWGFSSLWCGAVQLARERCKTLTGVFKLGFTLCGADGATLPFSAPVLGEGWWQCPLANRSATFFITVGESGLSLWLLCKWKANVRGM